jgi:hypothetical protein
MYVVTTNSGSWIQDSNTEIRVEFEDDAKAEADRWSGPGESMVEKCVWRFLYENRDEVHGSSVVFRLSKRDVLELIDRLRIANAEKLN